MNECSICYAQKTNFVALTCRHEFCANCIEKQLHFNIYCAFCKTPITACNPPIIKPSNKYIKIEGNGGEQLEIIIKTVKINNKCCVVVTNNASNKYPFQKGDLIISINGLPVSNHLLLRDLIMFLDSFEIQVKRKYTVKTFLNKMLAIKKC